MDAIYDYNGPPVCGHCGYELFPAGRDAKDLAEMSGVSPDEPAPTGWVHNPAMVDWENDYCNLPECGNGPLSHHTAYPHDGGSVEMHEHAAGEMMKAVDTKFQFDDIMKNNNLGIQFD